MPISPQEVKLWLKDRDRIIDQIDVAILNQYKDKNSEIKVPCSYSEFTDKTLFKALQTIYNRLGWEVGFYSQENEVTKSQYFITIREKT